MILILANPIAEVIVKLVRSIDSKVEGYELKSRQFKFQILKLKFVIFFLSKFAKHYAFHPTQKRKRIKILKTELH